MKDYMAPEMEVIEIKMQSLMQTISGTDGDDDDDPFDGGSGSNDPNVPFG